MFAVEEYSLLDALSFSAILSTVALFLCGVEICQRISRKGSTEGVDAAPFLLTFISCCLWTQYGVLKQDGTIICINLIGVVIEAAYLLYYHRMTRNRRRLNKILLFELILFLAMYGYTTSETYELKDRIDHLGVICMLMNIASLGSPLLALGGVIRNKSSESLPFPLCMGNLLVSSQWLMYGVLTDDVYIKIPNGIGVGMSMIQLSFFVIYPVRKRASDKQLLL